MILAFQKLCLLAANQERSNALTDESAYYMREKHRQSDAFPAVYLIKYILKAMRSGSLSKTAFYHTGK